MTVIRTWTVPSSTNPAKKYTVSMYADSSFSCNCTRWTRNCPHIIGIETVLRLNETDAAIEQSKLQPTRKRTITTLEE